MVFKSFDILRSVGIANINIDLMFGIPGQTMEIWRETLREAVFHCGTIIPQYSRKPAADCINQEQRREFTTAQHGIPNPQFFIHVKIYGPLIQPFKPSAHQNQLIEFCQFENFRVIQRWRRGAEVDDAARSLARHRGKGVPQHIGPKHHPRPASERCGIHMPKCVARIRPVVVGMQLVSEFMKGTARHAEPGQLEKLGEEGQGVESHQPTMPAIQCQSPQMPWIASLMKSEK